MKSEELLQGIIEKARISINTAEKLKSYDTPTLTWRENPTSWNVLECLRHLNLYGDYYLPEMERRIKSSQTRPEPEFYSGWLGNYFAKSMLPKPKMKKMKTFKDKNPLRENLDISVIDEFIVQQYQLIELVGISRNVSLNKVKIPTSISTMINLKLGDTFQFYVNHIVRHLKQIDTILAAQNR